MFWSSPSRTIDILSFLTILIVIFSLLLFLKTKKGLLSIIIFSVFSNVVFYFSSGSRIFAIYNLKWFVFFIINLWPWINVLLLLLLVFKYARNKKRNEE
jgi:hypothetical protein